MKHGEEEARGGQGPELHGFDDEELPGCVGAGVRGYEGAAVLRSRSRGVPRSEGVQVLGYSGTGHPLAEWVEDAVPGQPNKAKAPFSDMVLFYAAWRVIGLATAQSVMDGGPDSLDDDHVEAVAAAWIDRWWPTAELDLILEPFHKARDEMKRGRPNVWAVAEQEQMDADLFEQYSRSPSLLKLAMNCKACARIQLDQGSQDGRFPMSQEHAAVVMGKWLSSGKIDSAAGRRALQNLERRGYIKRVSDGQRRGVKDPKDRTGKKTLKALAAEFVWIGGGL